jgi:hypothetical protein
MPPLKVEACPTPKVAKNPESNLILDWEFAKYLTPFKVVTGKEVRFAKELLVVIIPGKFCIVFLKDNEPAFKYN